MAESHNARRNAKGKKARAIKKNRDAGAGGIRSGRQELSVTRGHIYEHGEYAPDEPRKPGPPILSTNEVIMLKDLILAGRTQQQVAEQMGLPPGVVARVCKVLKIDIGEKENGNTDSADTGPMGPGPRGEIDLLADHDRGVCGDSCRRGRHRYRSNEDI